MTLDEFKYKWWQEYAYLKHHADKYGLLHECEETLTNFISKYNHSMTSDEALREVNDALWEWDI